MVSIKEFLDPSTLQWPTTDAEGNIDWREPDIAMALPFVGVDGNTPNGAVWPWRLSLGAEDDPNRAKVYKWEQVDDLGGLAPLWAGVYNGTIFLHAGEQAPTAATDDSSDATGTPVASEDDVWHNGEPLPPFAPVPMDSRESMLRNSKGAWRRLVWEPVALFDVCTSKSFYAEVTETTRRHNLERYTLYMVVEYPYVAFYTSKAALDDAALDDDAEPRWPYGHYATVVQGEPHATAGKTYGAKGVDGGFPVGFGQDWYWRYYWGYRLAPLPWQADNGELETAEEFQPCDGVQEGQFYNLPQQFPCGRYLATFYNPHVAEALELAYVDKANEKNKEEHGEDAAPIFAYEELTKDEAKNVIQEVIRKKATESYSVDPALWEEKGNGFPTGEFNRDIYRVEDPPPYFTVFSLHLEKGEDRWPHWLAMFASLSQTALLTASVCAWYNDFRPAGGWPDDETGNLPEADESDPDDVAPGEKEEDTNDSNGGVIPADPDGKDEDDPPEETPPDGGSDINDKYGFCFYRAGNGVKVSSDWQPKIAGWKFTVQVETTEIFGVVDYNATLTVSTANDDMQYDSIHGDGLSMFYGVELAQSSASAINVKWKSSGPPNDGKDNLPKTATASTNTSANVSMSLVFEPLSVTSNDSPNSFCGNLLVAKEDGEIKKRFTKRAWNHLTGKYETEIFYNVYTVYKLSRSETLLKWMEAYYVRLSPKMPATRVNGTTNDADCSAGESFIQGFSEGLTGPRVTAVEAFCVPSSTDPETVLCYGKFAAVAYIDYVATAEYTVAGGSSWDAHGARTGRINGTFTATYNDTVTRTVKF